VWWAKTNKFTQKMLRSLPTPRTIKSRSVVGKKPTNLLKKCSDLCPPYETDHSFTLPSGIIAPVKITPIKLALLNSARTKLLLVKLALVKSVLAK
jgi:hypothetical protein